MRTASYVTEETLGGRTRAWLKTVRSAVSARPHLTLDPARCGLLVVDMLNYFATPGQRCYLPATAAITPRISALLTGWRQMGAPVLYTQHCHKGAEDLGMLGLFFSDHIHAGQPEAEIIPALAAGPGEPVLPKTTYDAFLDTPLASMLQQRGCSQLLVTGVLTHMCCETTARAAFCRGFEVYVAADAMASSSEKLHLNSLLAMADSVAVVMSTAEVLKRCSASR
jgi:isochorismate hydrolase